MVVPLLTGLGGVVLLVIFFALSSAEGSFAVLVAAIALLVFSAIRFVLDRRNRPSNKAPNADR
ncbi:hypothetical protein ACFSBZ_17085 [Amnibacterium flavum]|nr:hypothetical protein [Amnibacterium flavum]